MGPYKEGFRVYLRDESYLPAKRDESLPEVTCGTRSISIHSGKTTSCIVSSEMELEDVGQLRPLGERKSGSETSAQGRASFDGDAEVLCRRVMENFLVFPEENINKRIKY